MGVRPKVRLYGLRLQANFASVMLTCTISFQKERKKESKKGKKERTERKKEQKERTERN